MDLSTTTTFTPVAALAGGALIGLGAVMLMVVFGRILGVAGVTTAAVAARGPERTWRIAFLAGLIATPVIVLLATGGWPRQSVPPAGASVALAGLAVGFGTALGSGCTSGHGVCGLARLSPRSAVAVGVFMASAVATVFVLRHVV